MRGERVIVHADCNNFYASCECLERPELRDVPMAVAGDPENRVGVVVAKNELAKQFGVRTTDTVYAARQKCPGIVFVPPRHGYYSKISKRVNAIYREYTDYVEPASIDESFLDVTEALPFYGLTARDFADQLRERVKAEIGITISVGVSFCKVFAKMGSDYKKPDATTLVTRENYRDLLWPLPVGDLFFAGHAAAEKLIRHDIRTIGDLANADPAEVQRLLGKQGHVLWQYANGIDDSPVKLFGEKREIKSVSRGHTFRRDLVTEAEVRTGIGALVDEVARSLRRHGLKGAVVSVQIRRPDMTVVSRQTTLDHNTHLQHEIQDVAFRLVKEHWRVGPTQPIRALTVGVTKLVPADEAVEQMSMFDMMENGNAARDRQERLEAAVEAVRRKHGDGSITLGYRENADIGVRRPGKKI
ncbi:MAG: DNA polymerase IV [Clostridia bacterium]|nr:DNA polymerase IV [Clostridia bacterium]